MSTFKAVTRFLICTVFIALQTSCSNTKTTPVVPAILPIPLSQNISEGTFILDSNTELAFDADFKSVALFFKSYIENGSSIRLKDTKSSHKIVFKKDNSIKNEEGYQLKVSKHTIAISASTATGAFYAFQSLRQLLPVHFENGLYKESEVSIQNIEIEDAPKFVYRGMHLDVGRHFFSVDFIKKYIDMISLLKMNTFHWHLTEDQGWRIEIKKYPKLNEIAAYRNETLIGHYNEQPHQFDGKKYGGYYTQEEIKEVVKYATERHVTIIPEIEMPGHSQAAISAYPELGCTGKQIEVATKWGIFDEIYCPNEFTFKFLEDVLDEVIELFPSKYIHIGGDEAPKKRWEESEYCQQLIKKEGLEDAHGLQSYFITRMEKYINSKGKQIIGWDEILEGGLAPNATVMSWRGTAGAITAAKQQHDVILTPQSHCYFDHYQSDNENEPLAIGGFLPLKKVYHFNPIPKELTKEESKFVLGAQGNVWTEYISTPEQVEYMVFPRAIALAEVVWSSPENKSYPNFIKRLENFNLRLNALNVHYANHLYEVKGSLEASGEQLTYALTSTSKTHDIYYAVNNDEITERYTEPIIIETSAKLKAAVFNSKKEILGPVHEEEINLHKGVGKKISLSVAPDKAYNAGGKQALINGISGNNKRYGDSEWLGFNGEDVAITIDFDRPTEINSITTRFHNGNGQWIYAPKTFNLELTLEDGKRVSTKNSINNTTDLLVYFDVNLAQVYPKDEKPKTTQLKITIPNYGVIEEGKQGAGHKAWTFIDEIIIE
jgi:hexosaminidase